MTSSMVKKKSDGEKTTRWGDKPHAEWVAMLYPTDKKPKKVPTPKIK